MKLTAYDIEEVLETLGIVSAGPPVNSLCYSRSRLASEIFGKLHDKIMGWDNKPEASEVDEVIIGNG